MSEPSTNRQPRGPGPLSAILLTLIRVYKILISQLFTGSCRFLPSCSSYAQEAVERHGAFRGGWLATRRLARCHPLCKGGFDPVPAEYRHVKAR